MLSPEILSQKLLALRKSTLPEWNVVSPAAFQGKTVLVPGGAGSIGAEFVKSLIPLSPEKILITDPDENALSHLIRDIRNRFDPESLPEITTLSLGIGTPLFEDWVKTQDSFDYIFSFAARKHVRAERDVWSTLAMFECNVLAHARLFERFPQSRVFSVSTDKASAPANLMGASKRMMERFLFSGPGQKQARSARFANVLFSAGSLTESFGHRYLNQQPFACPQGVKRFLMSKAEAARLCLIAGLSEQPGIYFPDFDADQRQILLSDLLLTYMEALNLKPLALTSERLALERAAKRKTEDPWPVLWTENDTPGEKNAEQFYSAEEIAEETGYPGMKYVSRVLPYTEGDKADILAQLEAWLHQTPAGGLEEVRAWVRHWVPEYQPAEGRRSLDEKM